MEHYAFNIAMFAMLCLTTTGVVAMILVVGSNAGSETEPEVEKHAAFDQDCECERCRNWDYL